MNAYIVVEKDRIKSVGQSEDEAIDMARYTAIPGMIDVHTHLTMDTNFDPYHELSTSIAKSALIGARNAKVTLQAR